MFQQESKSSGVNESDDGSSMIVVSTSREVLVPTNASMTRITVLNALSRIVPRVACIVVGTVYYKVMIIGFYYQSNKLRCMVLDMQTQKVFDVFTYHADLIHYAISCRDILQFDNPHTIDWNLITGNTTWENMYIYSPLHENFIVMKSILCAAVTNVKFSKSLLNWFNKFTVVDTWLGSDIVPNGYINLWRSAHLRGTPKTFGLAKNKCHTKSCICKAVRVYLRSNKITDPQHLPMFLRCQAHVSIQDYFRDMISKMFITL